MLRTTHHCLSVEDHHIDSDWQSCFKTINHCPHAIAHQQKITIGIGNACAKGRIGSQRNNWFATFFRPDFRYCYSRFLIAVVHSSSPFLNGLSLYKSDRSKTLGQRGYNRLFNTIFFVFPHRGEKNWIFKTNDCSRWRLTGIIGWMSLFFYSIESLLPFKRPLLFQKHLLRTRPFEWVSIDCFEK